MQETNAGSIPGLGRSPGGGHGDSLQCYCLENPMDRVAWQAAVRRVAESRTCLKRLSKHARCPRSSDSPRGAGWVERHVHIFWRKKKKYLQTIFVPWSPRTSVLHSPEIPGHLECSESKLERLTLRSAADALLWIPGGAGERTRHALKTSP